MSEYDNFCIFYFESNEKVRMTNYSLDMAY